jgi:hypothetical protein
MDTATQNVFTAAEIAAAIGVTPRAVRKQLGPVSATGWKIVSGQRAAAWAVEVFPPRLRDAWLSTPMRRWSPPLPMREIAQQDIDAATKLHRALFPSLNRQHEPMPAAEFERLGLEDYRREYGHTISPRYFRELLARTRQRDGGAEDWSRLEIFLPAKLTAPAPSTVATETLKADLSALANHAALCADHLKPTACEWAGIWAKAFEEIERLVAEGWPEQDAGRAVRDCMAELPSLRLVNRHALRMQFARKLAAWRESKTTAALCDKRENNGQPFELPKNDADLLVSTAGDRYRGYLAPAFRELIATRRFSAETMTRYAHVLHTRGYMPKAVAEDWGYKARLRYLYNLGELDEATGSIDRDWHRMPSLRCYSADDLTPCVYFYVPDGAGWFRLVRGQLLVFEDFGSGMILGYSLQKEPQYNSLVIRSLCTHVFAMYGVPIGLYFENGLWRRSRLMKGGKGNPLSHAEMTRGLEDLGIRFTHTKWAWSKPIEKSFDLLQTLMQSEPGYCGRNERYDLPPAMKRAKQLVEARKAHPQELGLHSYDSWKVRIGQLCEQFNRTPQHGVRCGGDSPNAACEARLPRNSNGEIVPNVTCGPEFRHLLALHREPRPVLASGIEFAFGRRKFRYRDTSIGHLVGQTVIAGFDPEHPDMLTVEEPQTRKVICVPLNEQVHPAERIFGCEDGALAREHARVNGQIAETLAYFKALDCQFALPQRGIVADALTVRNSQAIAQGRERIREEKKLTERARRLRENTGVNVSPETLRAVTAEDDAQFNQWLKGAQ